MFQAAVIGLCARGTHDREIGINLRRDESSAAVSDLPSRTLGRGWRGSGPLGIEASVITDTCNHLRGMFYCQGRSINGAQPTKSESSDCSRRRPFIRPSDFRDGSIEATVTGTRIFVSSVEWFSLVNVMLASSSAPFFRFGQRRWYWKLSLKFPRTESK